MSLKAVANAVALGTCGFCKVPQIRQALATKSVLGLSANTLLLEMATYTISTSYFITQGYAVTDFLEYPFLILQQFTLLAYFALCQNKSYGFMALGFALWCIIFFCMATGVVPAPVLATLVSLNIPIGMSGKLAMIHNIVQTQRGDAVALGTWIMLGSSSACRVYTVMLETADPVLITNFSISVLMNIAVIVTAKIYTYDPDKRKKAE